MRRPVVWSLAVGSLAIAGTVVWAGGAPTAPTEAPAPETEDEVRRTVEQFHRALEAGDSAAVVALLHPEARVYEGGRAESRSEYRRGHLGADIAFLAAVEAETVREEVVPGDRLALYLRESRVKGTFRDREVDAHGTETLALQRRDGGWAIRHIHWSTR